MLPLFPELDMLQLILSVLIIFVAYAVKGLSGFGSGLIAIPLLAFMFPLSFVVPVLGLLSYGGTVMQSAQLHRQASWRDVLPLIPFSIAGVVLAVWLLVNTDPRLLALSLGVFVLSYAVYSLLPLRHLSGGRVWAIPAGAFGGMVGALFGTGGPFYVIYLKMRQLDKQHFRASIAVTFLLDGGARVVGYAMSGLYTREVLIMLVMLVPVLWFGMYVGNHLHIRINQRRFNQVISVLLMVSGGMLIYKSLMH